MCSYIEAANGDNRPCFPNAYATRHTQVLPSPALQHTPRRLIGSKRLRSRAVLLMSSCPPRWTRRRKGRSSHVTPLRTCLLHPSRTSKSVAFGGGPRTQTHQTPPHVEAPAPERRQQKAEPQFQSGKEPGCRSGQTKRADEPVLLPNWRVTTKHGLRREIVSAAFCLEQGTGAMAHPSSLSNDIRN